MNPREHRLRQRIDTLTDRIERLERLLAKARHRADLYYDRCYDARKAANLWKARARRH